MPSFPWWWWRRRWCHTSKFASVKKTKHTFQVVNQGNIVAAGAPVDNIISITPTLEMCPHAELLVYMIAGGDKLEVVTDVFTLSPTRCFQKEVKLVNVDLLALTIRLFLGETCEFVLITTLVLDNICEFVLTTTLVLVKTCEYCLYCVNHPTYILHSFCAVICHIRLAVCLAMSLCSW